jgi:peptidyl-prolyl cis-trans isomerase C
MLSKPEPILHIVQQVATCGTPSNCSIALTALAILSGCTASEPKGQVIAVVNGEEVTIPELNAEARARGVDIGTNPALRNGLVQELVQRKLLVQEARRREVDRDPDYLLATRRLDEMLLVDQLASAAVPGAAPTDDEIAEYIRSHPQAFGQRMLWSVEQLSFRPVQEAQLRRSIETAPSLDAIGRLLRRAGIETVRQKELWDSAMLPAEWHRQLLAAGTGDAVLLRKPEWTIAVQLLSGSPNPVPESQRAALARQMRRQELRQAALEQVLQDVQSDARITYQDDFAP